jgi:hypothetical protein
LLRGGGISIVPASATSFGQFTELECGHCRGAVGGAMYAFFGLGVSALFTSDLGITWSP